LGLLVNNEERVVRRKGMPGEEAKLTGLTWWVFKLCLDAGANGIKWDDCRARYPGKWKARHVVAADLRTRLENLNVGIAKGELRIVPLD